MAVYQGFTSRYPQVIKQESFNSPLYATPPLHEVGVARRHSLFAGRGLEYRPSGCSEGYSFSSTGAGAPSTMPQKRGAPPSENNGTPAKHVKGEHPEEFSNAVKKRLQSSTRTGQACDRCKVCWGLFPSFMDILSLEEHMFSLARGEPVEFGSRIATASAAIKCLEDGGTILIVALGRYACRGN